MRRRQKLDWDTVELAQPARKIVVERRRFSAQRVLAGASMKARSAGALYTHAQICRMLEPGFATLAYGWGFVAAAMTLDLARSVEVAAFVICETSAALALTIS